jgi:hypothetical protein
MRIVVLVMAREGITEVSTGVLMTGRISLE